jgi:glutamate---cysteine ligase / carboxylate-amine ligase
VRTVGVEEELLVVDAGGAPVPLGPAALEVAARRGEGETPAEHDSGEGAAHLVPELQRQQIELGTRVCTTLQQVDGELRYWRRRADDAARAVSARVAALATSPVPVAPETTPGERFARIEEVFALTCREQLTCGCHVHVQVADEEEGVAVLNRIRGWLPVLTALTANSPFWQGRDTGYASYRWQAWGRWPSAGPNEPFTDAADYHRLTEQMLATGTVLDSGQLYFDARLSEKWPTVEIRTADVALRVDDAVTVAGLVRGLVETAARDAAAGSPAPAQRGELLRLAAWRASRSGLAGDLVHPRTGRPAPAAEVLAALLDHVRPALADAGDERRVAAGIADLLHRGTGADLQRAVHRETGDLHAVVRAAIELTHAAPAAAVPAH